jgi:hypothetical protein
MRTLTIFLLFALAVCCPSAATAQENPMDALVGILKTADDPQFQLDLLRGMSEGLKGQRNVPTPAGWDEVAAKLAQSPDAQVRELTRALSLTFGSKGAMTALRAQLLDASLEAEKRHGALESLLAARDPELAASLQTLLKDAALRGAALRGLAAYDDAKTPAAVLGVYPSLNVGEKRDALSTLVSRVSFAR